MTDLVEIFEANISLDIDGEILRSPSVDDIRKISRIERNRALVASAQLGWFPLVEGLLKEGADVDWRDEREEASGATPLLFSAWCGNYEIVEALIAFGANPNYEGFLPFFGQPQRVAVLPLQASVLGSGYGGGDARIVRALVKAGADRNRKDGLGHTAEFYFMDLEYSNLRDAPLDPIKNALMIYRGD